MGEIHVWQADDKLRCQRASYREHDFAISITFGNVSSAQRIELKKLLERLPQKRLSCITTWITKTSGQPSPKVRKSLAAPHICSECGPKNDAVCEPIAHCLQAATVSLQTPYTRLLFRVFLTYPTESR